MAPDVVNPVAIGLHIQCRNKQSKTLKATQNEKKTLGFILCIVIGEVRGKAEKHLLSRLLVATSACSQTTAAVSATTRRAWWPTPTAPPASGHKTVALPTALLTALNPRCMFVSRPPPPECSPWLSFLRSRRQSAAATGKKQLLQGLPIFCWENCFEIHEPITASWCLLLEKKERLYSTLHRNNSGGDSNTESTLH